MKPAFPEISEILYQGRSSKNPWLSNTTIPPKEPTKHQYDFDAATCLNFLREYGPLEHFKLNLETNHATLAGHTMHHECEVAAAAGALSTLDADTGDELIGWDTDQFPTSLT
ncbi:MAG TPA: hypothetical protein VK673_01215 [Chthoniobacterales bacterium]|nr:hypothetical protein [Chthoniobacterales bacterium]